MTNPTSEIPVWHNWAWKQLGAPPEASAAAANLAALAVLAQSDFEPPADLRPALQIKQALDHSSTPPERALAAFQKSSVQELRDSIEKFAQNYWSMAPADRQEMYQRLVAEAKDLPLANLRLEGLREGLAIEAITTVEEDPTRVLARKVQDIYVLAPLERAVRRHELAATLRNQAGGRVALQLLPEDFPQIARLDRSFNSRIVEEPRKLKLTLKHLEEPVAANPSRSNNSGSSWWSGNFWGGGSRAAGTVLVLVLSSLTRMCLTSNHHSPPLNPVPRVSDPIPGLKLQIRTGPDGKVTLETVDSNGNVIPALPAPKKPTESGEEPAKKR